MTSGVPGRAVVHDPERGQVGHRGLALEKTRGEVDCSQLEAASARDEQPICVALASEGRAGEPCRILLAPDPNRPSVRALAQAGNVRARNREPVSKHC